MSASRTIAGTAARGVVEGFVRNALESDRTPRLVVDSDGTIAWASQGVEDLLQPPLPLSIRNGRLQANGGPAARGYEAFLENLGDKVEQLFLPGKAPGNWILLRGWRDREAGDRLAYLQCALSWPLRDVESSGLARDFGLTPSESAVLDLFARLLKPVDIAEQLNVSVSTVRSHLKQIHTKMAVTTGVQLLRITRAYCDR